jgi:hypothetical protein
MLVLDKHMPVLETVSVPAVTFTRLLSLVALKVKRQKQFTVKQYVTLSILTYGECVTLVTFIFSPSPSSSEISLVRWLLI